MISNKDFSENHHLIDGCNQILSTRSNYCISLFLNGFFILYLTNPDAVIALPGFVSFSCRHLVTHPPQFMIDCLPVEERRVLFFFFIR